MFKTNISDEYHTSPPTPWSFTSLCGQVEVRPKAIGRTQRKKKITYSVFQVTVHSSSNHSEKLTLAWAGMYGVQ